MPKEWKRKSGKLVREFEFSNFEKALSFVNKVGELAQKADHHPDIYLYSYRKVRISLTTHDKGDMLTQKDFDLAEKIDKVAPVL